MTRVVLLLSLVGCSDSGSPMVDAGPIYPDPPATPVDVRWALFTAAGELAPCPDAAATADIISIYMRRGPQPPITVRCKTGAQIVVIDPEPKEGGAVQVNIRRGEGTLYAITPMQIVQTTGLQIEKDFAMIVDRGYISVRLQYTRSGTPITCDASLPKATMTFTPSIGSTESNSVVCGSVTRTGPLTSGATVRVDIDVRGSAVSVDNLIVPTGQITLEVPTINVPIP